MMKTRERITSNKIALLATGDEICQGDIVNTNSYHIANELQNVNMQVGLHMTVGDRLSEIESAIRYLLTSHEALIITGGLGPTSDDLTRHALANYLGKPLRFDEPTWNDIVTRLKKFGYDNPPESNRQQALFPEGSIIIPNKNGTASGCQIDHQGKLIFMLPGPPPECLPLIETIVLPVLQEHHFQQTIYRKNWLLFGVSEGQIAEELDRLLNQYDCTTGYRIHYPYIEFKVHTLHADIFEKIVPLVENIVAPFLISRGKFTASQELKHQLSQQKYGIQICDLATGGELEIALKSPETINQIKFISSMTSHEIPTFQLEGLTEYWESKDTKQTEIILTYYFRDQKIKKHTLAPNRGSRVKRYAMEWASYQINQLLRELP